MRVSGRRTRKMELKVTKMGWGQLCQRLGVDDAAAATARPEVKDTLRRNTERAIAEGLFGVPTLAIDDQHFWGFDMTDAAIAYLGGDPIFDASLMTRAGALPDGVTRVPR
jgi:hypothetical protein